MYNSYRNCDDDDAQVWIVEPKQWRRKLRLTDRMSWLRMLARGEFETVVSSNFNSDLPIYNAGVHVCVLRFFLYFGYYCEYSLVYIIIVIYWQIKDVSL
jgi:hypothetical protein